MSDDDYNNMHHYLYIATPLAPRNSIFCFPNKQTAVQHQLKTKKYCSIHPGCFCTLHLSFPCFFLIQKNKTYWKALKIGTFYSLSSQVELRGSNIRSSKYAGDAESSWDELHKEDSCSDNDAFMRRASLSFNLQFWSDWICQFRDKNTQCWECVPLRELFLTAPTSTGSHPLSCCLPLQADSRACHTLTVSSCYTSCHCNTVYEQALFPCLATHHQTVSHTLPSEVTSRCIKNIPFSLCELIEKHIFKERKATELQWLTHCLYVDHVLLQIFCKHPVFTPRMTSVGAQQGSDAPQSPGKWLMSNRKWCGVFRGVCKQTGSCLFHTNSTLCCRCAAEPLTVDWVSDIT